MMRMFSTFNTSPFLQKFFRKIEQGKKKDIFVLIITGILIHSPFLIWDIISNGKNPLFTGWDNVDLNVYKNRAKAILRGEYFNTVVSIKPNQFIPGFGSPPLINYLFVPLSLFSFTPLAFECYFVCWNLATAILIYKICQNKGIDNKKSLLAGLFYLLNPITIMNATWRLTDEAIAVFFLVLPFYLLKRGVRWSIVGVIIGFYVKLLPIILLPLFFAECKRVNTSIIKELLIAVLLLIGIGAPFFLTYFESHTLEIPYSLTTGNDQSEGYALVRIIFKIVGFPVYGLVKLFLLFLFLLGALLFLKILSDKNIDIHVKAGFIILFWFFITWQWFIEYLAYIIPSVAILFINRSNNSPNYPSRFYPVLFTFNHWIFLFLTAELLLFCSHWIVFSIGYRLPLLVVALLGFLFLIYSWVELISFSFLDISSRKSNSVP